MLPRHAAQPAARKCALSALKRACLALALLAPTAALAQEAGPAEKNQPTPGPAAGQWDSTLLGEAGGVRPALDAHGIQFGLTDTEEVLGNLAGGTRRGTIYEALTEMSLGIDLGRAIGLDGGVINASAFQIRGRGLSTWYVGNIATVSNIEADPTTRLFELFYQQAFLGGKLDVKIGQQSADLEFLDTLYGGLFLNASFGWPMLPSPVLPSGGPAYPLATPGARLRLHPIESLTILAAVFNGSPAGLASGDPQKLNPSGTNFDMDSGVFAIGEVQYAASPAPGLPGTYKLGFWYNSNTFPVGAAPGSRTHRGDWSIYAVIDQLLFRPPGSDDGGAGLFLRAMAAPADRSEVDAFVDGGISYKGAFGRDNDTMGIGFGWTHVSAAAAFNPPPYRRSAETLVELTYQAQLTPWWTVQPDAQYVLRPGGGIADPGRPGHRISDAVVLGLRSTMTF